jgi:isoleucyl-tRNA synthetase
MHGFFVDEKGEKMSKSLGNFIPLEDILEKYGADSFRLWGMSNTVWDELKFSWEEMKKASSELNIVLNIVMFLERFYDQKLIKNIKLSQEDQWVMSRLQTTVTEFSRFMEEYNLSKATKTLRAFVIDDVSRFYMKLAKDRIQKKDNDAAALATLYKVTYESLRLLSIFSPFLCEHLYRRFFMKYEKEESIFMHLLSAEDTSCVNTIAEKQMEIVREISSVALTARQSAGIKLRWPVGSVVVETKSHEVTDAVNTFSSIMRGLLNVKNVSTSDKAPAGEFVSQAFSMGTVHIDKQLNEALYKEGVINEVKRRIQSMRKEHGLVEKDKIIVHLSAEKELEVVIMKMKDELSAAVNAKTISFAIDKSMKEYEIDGRVVKLALKKAE